MTIVQRPAEGGTEVGDIILTGGTFTWADGTINSGGLSGNVAGVFRVQQGATLHINLGGKTLTLGDYLSNNGGTINVVGGPPAGSTLTFSNGCGLVNVSGNVNVSYDVALTRLQGGAANLNNAYIHNYSAGTILWRDGTSSSELPVANGGTFKVLAETKATQVTIKNANPNTANLGFNQTLGVTHIEANGFNSTLSVNEGYQAASSTLKALASSSAVTPKLESSNGDIKLGVSGQAMVPTTFLAVGDSTSTVRHDSQNRFERGRPLA